MINQKSNWYWIAFVSFCLIIINSALPAFSNSSSHIAKPHPLPISLAQWQDTEDWGNYFDLIETTSVGYLVWSQFPIKVYVEPILNLDDSTAEALRWQQWTDGVQQAIAEWNLYLPLQQVKQPDLADISIVRASVDRKAKLDPETGLYDIPRAITAQTTYQIYLQEPSQILAHKMTIQISPDLGSGATLAAARHELGHGLGIWGHSDRTSDALYFSQVRNTPSISPRDINTLKKIYQQPTKLGWKVKNISNVEVDHLNLATMSSKSSN